MRTAPASHPHPGHPLLLKLGALATLGVAGLALYAMTHPVFAAEPALERQQALVRFVRQECGFCHGLTLGGGLGSPLTAEAMRARPAEVLAAVIQHGIPGTAMPPWSPYLSAAETDWIVARLQEGFPQ
ncbi:MAG: cytochrome c [Pseudomonadota bacterium]